MAALNGRRMALGNTKPRHHHQHKGTTTMTHGQIHARHTESGYTPEEQDAIGREVAEMFGMKHDVECPTRWRTTWGTKTNVGIFNTIRRLAQDIEEHNPIKA